MKTLRQIHLYLGCIFSPMIIYFSVSGAWQVFRFSDVPKNQPPSAIRSFLHELSKPHTDSTLPSLSPKTESSTAFNWLALSMGLGMVATALRWKRGIADQITSPSVNSQAEATVAAAVNRYCQLVATALDGPVVPEVKNKAAVSSGVKPSAAGGFAGV